MGDHPKTLSSDEYVESLALSGSSDDLGCDYRDHSAGANTAPHWRGQALAYREEPSFELPQPSEPQSHTLDAGQIGSILFQHSPDFSIDRFIDYQPVDLSPPKLDAHSPVTSLCETTTPSVFSDYDQRTSQSTTSSPTLDEPQVNCDFCGAHFSVADALCTHIIADHGQFPLRCGRPTCKSVKTRRSLMRHLEHKHFDIVFYCRCGTLGRYDQHVRHLGLNNCVGHDLYRCGCGHAESDTKTHRSHIDYCDMGKNGKKGRPRKKRE